MADSSDEEARDGNTTGRPTVRIPKYKRGDEVVEWSEVDAEWWAHVQHANRVYEQVLERLRYEPGIEGTSLSRGDETIAGHTTSAITIIVSDEETARRLEIAEEKDGIPIKVEIGSITDAK